MCACLAIAVAAQVHAAADSTGGSLPEGTDQAMSLLHDYCLSCHNPEKQKGGLRLDTREGVLAGGGSGPAAVAGDPESSLLFKALQPGADPHMPPQQQLAASEIEVIRRWIAQEMPWNEAALRGQTRFREVVLESLPPGYQPCLALALAPDGRMLAVGRGHRIVLHDTSLTNFPVVTSFAAHRDAVRALAWSPDGRLLASGGFRELTVWEMDSCTARWSAGAGLVGRVTALRFSSYGGVLLAADSVAGETGWVRLFKADAGEVVGGWAAHRDAIYDLAVSPEGGLLATAGGDKLIRLWEVISQRQVAELEGHSGAVTGLAFSTNGWELAAVSTDKQLKVWNVKSRESTLNMSGRKHALNAAAWSADGRLVVAVDEDGGIASFANFKHHTGEQSSATAEERRLGRWAEPLHAVAVSADGRRVFAGGQDGIVYAVSDQGKLLATLRPEQETPVAEEGPAPAWPAPGQLEEAAPSFVYHVLPVLSKAGCSAGSCHAKPEGQGGFKLSVFNYDPRSDFAEMVKELRGRRVSPGAPAESLLLLKPTLGVAHGGGRRLEPGSSSYELLLRWIRSGMVFQHTTEPALTAVTVHPREGSYRKGVRQPLRVEARYADGSLRDVTALAHYAVNDKEIASVDSDGLVHIGQISGETAVTARFMGLVDAARITVPADRLLPQEEYARLPRNNFIDDLAWASLQKLGLFPSDLSSDAEFLRRSTLDTIGMLPSADEARAFLADPDPAKREQWIDHLLTRPAYADFWANRWADLLRPNPDRVGVKSVFVLDQWLRESFRANKPYDQFVREILEAEGNNHRDGPIVIYRDRREPAELTTLFSQLFLGVRMECAKCHHHPNEKWSLDDFYQFAAFFGPLKQKGAGLSPPISAGTETFYFGSGGAVKHPVTDQVMAPRAPDGPLVNRADEDPRGQLADWLTYPGNPFFARAAVNRVWAAFFGRGFVEPVDDFRVSNPIVNEPLLDALARDFVEHRYDFKHLIRTILHSRLYQLSSRPNETNLADTRHFSRSWRRRLPAEVLLDAVSDVTRVPEEFHGVPAGARALQTWSYKIASHFLDAFGRPNPSSDCPCERDTRPSVVQSLHMMNSQALQAKLAHARGRVAELVASPLPPAEVVTELYYTTLSRPPADHELHAAVAAFQQPHATRQTGVEDVLWALLNSAEFVFNH